MPRADGRDVGGGDEEDTLVHAGTPEQQGFPDEDDDVQDRPQQRKGPHDGSHRAA